MQAVGPRVSGLLTLDKTRRRRRGRAQTTTWQVAIIWPIYLVVGSLRRACCSASSGPSTSRPRRRWSSSRSGCSSSCLGGPCDSVILMSGRSRQSLFNSAAALAVNVVGNLLFVPDVRHQRRRRRLGRHPRRRGRPARHPGRPHARDPALVDADVPHHGLALGTVGRGLPRRPDRPRRDLDRARRGRRASAESRIRRSRGGSDGRYTSRPSSTASVGRGPGHCPSHHDRPRRHRMPQERESATLSDYTAIIARRWRVVRRDRARLHGARRRCTASRAAAQLHEQRVARHPADPHGPVREQPHRGRRRRHRRPRCSTRRSSPTRSRSG